MSVWDQPFLFVRAPGGNVEDVDRMWAAGFRSIFVNVRDHPPVAWETVRRKAAAAGMPCGPWGHTTKAGGVFSVEVLDLLVQTADAWRSPLIVNSEKEIDGSGDTLTKLIAEKVGGRDAAISMQAFLFFSVEWGPVKHLPMLLQIFPAESPAAHDPTGCRQRAWDAGCENVYMTFGSYAGQKPSLYDLKAPYSIFTADDCGQNYQAWRPTSTGYVSKKPASKPPPVPTSLPSVKIPLPRPVKLRTPNYMVGVDITAHKRATYRYIGAPYAWGKLRTSNAVTRRTYGPSFNVLVNDARSKAGLVVGRGVDEPLYAAMRKAGAYLPYEDSLLLKWQAAHPVNTLVHPIPASYKFHVCQGLHETGGLPNNWAIDFCADPNTPIVAAEAGVISRLSGSAPRYDKNDRTGAFGWTVYIQALRTYEYFITHLGTRPSELRVGLRVQPGDTIGLVGDQDYRPDHVHYGVSSSAGPSDARRRITAVSKAPRIR